MMNIYGVFLLVILSSVTQHTTCHDIEFSRDECLAAHNELRQLHANTNNIEYSFDLQREADIAARTYKQRDGDTTDVRPTRIEPKRRRRRHIDDNTKHLEEWDGDIFYPQRTRDRNSGRQIRIGENIHKFCCTSFPHCPQQFFHNLHFPPSAAGVVKDWYNVEVGNYDFDTGEKKKQFSQVSEFASIVWQNTTKIGCAQSSTSAAGCVYTVVLYEVEGGVGTPDDFKKNIGSLKSEAGESNDKIITIFLIIFFIVLLVALIIICYCCRQNIHDKMFEIRIKTDTMKAEQELETDSTRFWWLRIFKIKKQAQRRQTVSRPKKTAISERPTIEVVPNSAPIRTIRPSQRVRGDSNAASYVRYHGISRKAETMAVQDNYGYDKQLPQKPVPYQMPSDRQSHQGAVRQPSWSSDGSSHQRAVRQPSLSGKAAPPEPPIDDTHIYGNINPVVEKPPQKPPPRPNNQPPSQPLKPVMILPSQPLKPVAKTPSQPLKPVTKTPSQPLKPVTKAPSIPLTTNRPQTSPKPGAQNQSGEKVPLFPGARNSPKTQPRPFSSPVNQPNKPKPVPRKNTAPIEQTSTTHSNSPQVKPKPMLPPSTKLRPKI